MIACRIAVQVKLLLSGREPLASEDSGLRSGTGIRQVDAGGRHMKVGDAACETRRRPGDEACEWPLAADIGQSPFGKQLAAGGSRFAVASGKHLRLLTAAADCHPAVS